MLLPGATLGILGSGQLGRMLALEARRLGYRVQVFSPESDSPTGQVADREVVAAYDDLDAVAGFARGVDVVTFEFENVPAATAAAAAAHTLVRPNGAVLHTTQHRRREKDFLAGAGLPVTPYAAVDSLPELEAALKRIGLPAVLKTAGFGYDGKGQARINAASEAAAAWQAIGAQAAILEAWVPFERELSVVAARGADGDYRHFGVVENTHAQHILDLTVAPAAVPPEVAAEAVAISRVVLEALEVVGVLCVEFFLAPGGKLLVNELAPRPHNSGHFTLEACATSQFEQQLRAVCGLPLGATDQRAPAAMAQLLGDLWAGGEPNWAAALALPGVALHLYGKRVARRGRKMGHLTVPAPTVEEARARALAARAALTRETIRPHA
ncbi:MAG: 5-(carboxyamino)imidazole ribonucleotide synthase [Anaerolineales bacterium]|nr:5-(carboxyamino)imidazole ribonucleotide synthase [Anaerolineales bacterium]